MGAWILPPPPDRKPHAGDHCKRQRQGTVSTRPCCAAREPAGRAPCAPWCAAAAHYAKCVSRADFSVHTRVVLPGSHSRELNCLWLIASHPTQHGQQARGRVARSRHSYTWRRQRDMSDQHNTNAGTCTGPKRTFCSKPGCIHRCEHVEHVKNLSLL